MLKIEKKCIRKLCTDTHGQTYGVVGVRDDAILLFGPVVKESKLYYYMNPRTEVGRFTQITHETWKAEFKPI